MELSEKYLDASWTKDDNGKPQFFIINEAIVSKLCILGDDCEPCFEGAQITKLEFSFEDNFKTQLFSMMNELKEYLQEGGARKVFTRYAVEIGDGLWNAIYDYLENTYPDTEGYCSAYRIEGIFEENGQKFVVIQSRADSKYYRLNFSLTEDTGFVPSETLIEVTKSYTPAEEPQFALEAVEEYEAEYANRKKETEEDKNGEEEAPKIEDTVEEAEVIFELEEEPVVEEVCEETKTYNLEEVVEYTELLARFEELQTNYANLETEHNALKAELEPLKAFKLAAEKKDKQAMIDQFYMLSDEDKADVITNIDTYSIDDIEAKLAIICVRNKVSFDLDENTMNNSTPTVYNLQNEEDDADVPAWIKSLRETAKSM